MNTRNYQRRRLGIGGVMIFFLLFGSGCSTLFRVTDVLSMALIEDSSGSVRSSQAEPIGADRSAERSTETKQSGTQDFSRMEALAMYGMVSGTMAMINVFGNFRGLNLEPGEGVRYRYSGFDEYGYQEGFYSEMAFLQKRGNDELWYFALLEDRETKGGTETESIQYELLLGADGRVREIKLSFPDEKDIIRLSYVDMQEEIQPISQQWLFSGYETQKGEDPFGSRVRQETIQVGAGRFPAQVHEIVLENYAGMGNLFHRFWLNDSVPGRVVRYQFGESLGDQEYFFQIELDSYRQDYRPRWF